MTFIASVIAKKGVAIIADSLVTSSRPIIEFEDFNRLMTSKIKGLKKNSSIKIDPNEINNLFKIKPSHTKDYEEKMFEYDKYTAITTAGSAEINEMRIGVLINEMIERNKKNKQSYNRKRIETRVKEFTLFIKKHAIEHIKKRIIIRPTTFIFTHYNHNDDKTTIYKIVVNSCNSEILKKNPDFQLVTYELSPENYKVVCDGQNRISERILFGELQFLGFIIPKILERVSKDYPEVKDKILKPDYIKGVLTDKEILFNQFISEDVKMFKLTDLSLQQATDLAWLLMRIEIEIQKFTENIQTVGGVIKLAVIDKKGFYFIKGHEIIIPKTN